MKKEHLFVGLFAIATVIACNTSISVEKESTTICGNDTTMFNNIDWLKEDAPELTKNGYYTISRPKAIKGTWSDYHVSKRGKEFIKEQEGLRLTRYYACMKERLQGKGTIGYGHVITGEDRIPRVITKRRANKIFEQDIKAIEPCLNEALKQIPHAKDVEFSQGFVDGLASLIYNMGIGNFRKSKFFKSLKNIRYDKKHECLNQSDVEVILHRVKKVAVTEKGHIERRKKEYNLMRK